ncbi:MAG: DSD1 family PLP-dependent enzyme [Bacteroidota bacterium]
MDEVLKNMNGKPVEELPTPSIVADINELKSNLSKMDSYFNNKSSKLRPHFKSHKCVTLAKLQMEYPNTIGITCAKLSEAEQLVKGGVEDVLVANQVIGIDKCRRIALMNKNAIVGVAIDSYEGIEQLSYAADEIGVEISVLVEVDIGMNRGGVKPGQQVLELVEMISEKGGLRFDGLQSYEGHIVTLPNYDERKQRVEEDMKPLLETRKLLEQKGYSVFISSGGTGTYDITGNIEGIDELQCGSYALMDTAYKTIRPEFLNSRYILATVISKRGDVIATDVGLKGMGAEFSKPIIVGYLEAENHYIAEEHTVFENIDVNIGDKIKIIPPHGCTTNNFYSHMWISKNNIIEDVWPIEGRGCLE